ncbi:MAG: SIR2 family protein [Geminicoccaceae bacterium]
MTIGKLLSKARSGKAILFCGAGFSADCLNFDDADQIGVGEHLLRMLNEELRNDGHESSYRNLKNAADAFKNANGEHGLLELLVNRFDVQKVSADMISIVKFPWERIYTTNYDNGIEKALQEAGRQPKSLNNTERPNDVAGDGAEIVHLHGFIEKWDIRNFTQSCILGAESYHRLDILKEWLETFKTDVERAEVIVFIGTKSEDFHFNDVLFNATGLKDKIYFINRPSADPDPDTDMTQKRFGSPLYIGRQGLVRILESSLAAPRSDEPLLSSFQRYEIPEPSRTVPSVKDIEDLFIFGRIVPEHIARDIRQSRSDYHVQRSATKEILVELRNEINIALVTGEICDGKSLIVESLCNQLAMERPVYRLLQHYDDLLDEVARILDVHPSAALVVENCFDLYRERLKGLARLFDKSNGLLILYQPEYCCRSRGGRPESSG